MKKTIALLLALLLCVLSVSAMAEEKQVYTHPTKGYSITVPAQWLCVDISNIQQYITAYQNGEMTFTGTNAETLSNLLMQIQSQDCAILIDSSSNNVTITDVDMGIALDHKTFAALMIPQFKSQLSAQFPSMEFTCEGEILTFVDNTFVMLSGIYSMSNIPIEMTQLYYIDDTSLYVITTTAILLYDQALLQAFYEDAFAACSTLTIAE